MNLDTAFVNEIQKRIVKHEAYMQDQGFDIDNAIRNFLAIQACIINSKEIDVPYNQEMFHLTFTLLMYRYAKDSSHDNERRVEAFGMACTNPNGTIKPSISDIARRGAYARIFNDPKTNEKKFVYECWLDWQNKSSRYSSKADFARDMLEKTVHLKSQKKIEDWCREWERSNTIPAS